MSQYALIFLSSHKQSWLLLNCRLEARLITFCSYLTAAASAAAAAVAAAASADAVAADAADAADTSLLPAPSY